MNDTYNVKVVTISRKRSPWPYNWATFNQPYNR